MGSILRVKSRLCAGGHEEDKSSWTDLYSPTAGIVSIMILLSLAAFRSMKMEVIDIANAFLNVDVADNSYTLVEMDKQLTAFIVKNNNNNKGSFNFFSFI